eukprot:3286548-Prymnesium_polylepis.1
MQGMANCCRPLLPTTAADRTAATQKTEDGPIILDLPNQPCVQGGSGVSKVHIAISTVGDVSRVR